MEPDAVIYWEHILFESHQMLEVQTEETYAYILSRHRICIQHIFTNSYMFRVLSYTSTGRTHSQRTETTEHA